MAASDKKIENFSQLLDVIDERIEEQEQKSQKKQSKKDEKKSTINDAKLPTTLTAQEKRSFQQIGEAFAKGQERQFKRLQESIDVQKKMMGNVAGGDSSFSFFKKKEPKKEAPKKMNLLTKLMLLGTAVGALAYFVKRISEANGFSLSELGDNIKHAAENQLIRINNMFNTVFGQVENKLQDGGKGMVDSLGSDEFRQSIGNIVNQTLKAAIRTIFPNASEESTTSAATASSEIMTQDDEDKTVLSNPDKLLEEAKMRAQFVAEGAEQDKLIQQIQQQEDYQRQLMGIDSETGRQESVALTAGQKDFLSNYDFPFDVSSMDASTIQGIGDSLDIIHQMLAQSDNIQGGASAQLKSLLDAIDSNKDMTDDVKSAIKQALASYGRGSLRLSTEKFNQYVREESEKFKKDAMLGDQLGRFEAGEALSAVEVDKSAIITSTISLIREFFGQDVLKNFTDKITNIVEKGFGTLVDVFTSAQLISSSVSSSMSTSDESLTQKQTITYDKDGKVNISISLISLPQLNALLDSIENKEQEVIAELEKQDNVLSNLNTYLQGIETVDSKQTSGPVIVNASGGETQARQLVDKISGRLSKPWVNITTVSSMA